MSDALEACATLRVPILSRGESIASTGELTKPAKPDIVDENVAQIPMPAIQDKDRSLVLAEYVCGTVYDDMPEKVIDEAKRALLNWAGCAVGAADHPATQRAWRALAPYAGTAQASVIGRSEKTDARTAATLNGISSHVHDFDDTHPVSLVHPSAPVASAVVALAEHIGATGRELVLSVVVGVELASRISRSLLPVYEAGWHFTGTAGVFGSAAACARLLGLSVRETQWAIGLAATQASSLREMFGSMGKSLHPGKAAENGLTCALLAQSGFDSSVSSLDGPRGFAHAYGADLEAAVNGLGSGFEILENTYKPYACGLVLHPVIQACGEVAQSCGKPAGAIAGIEVRAHPLVLELTGKRSPSVGLEGKFSVYHSAAVGILDGRGDDAQFTDARVKSADVIALRDKIEVVITPGIPIESAEVFVRFADGTSVTHRVDDCIGSRRRPMTDDELAEKFRRHAVERLGSAKTEAAIGAFLRLESLDVRSCTDLLRP